MTRLNSEFLVDERDALLDGLEVPVADRLRHAAPQTALLQAAQVVQQSGVFVRSDQVFQTHRVDDVSALKGNGVKLVQCDIMYISVRWNLVASDKYIQLGLMYQAI